MNQPDRIPWGQFDAEVRLVRRLVEAPPWGLEQVHADGSAQGETDRGLRAAFRRWTPADEVPTVEMLAALYRHPKLGGKPLASPDGWSDDDTERAVRHAAKVLHLLALGADEGPEAANFGRACARAGVAEGRFARLVNTPASSRLEALGRAFRRFRQAGIRWSTGDLSDLLRFLFTDDPRPVIARWAAGYYRVGASEKAETESEPIQA